MPRIGTQLVYPELSYRLCGLCFDVHNSLGRYRNEKQYGDALEQLMTVAGISFEREKELPASFEGEHNRRNIVDFIVDNSIILDLKAKSFITKEDYFQMQRYLASSSKKLGIIINFRQKVLTPKRVVN